MHTWLPDAHSEAAVAHQRHAVRRVPEDRALCVAPLFISLTAACLGPAFSCHLLLGFGLLSMFLGCAVHPGAGESQAHAGVFKSRTRRADLCRIGLGTPLTIFGALCTWAITP